MHSTASNAACLSRHLLLTPLAGALKISRHIHQQRLPYVAVWLQSKVLQLFVASEHAEQDHARRRGLCLLGRHYLMLSTMVTSLTMVSIIYLRSAFTTAQNFEVDSETHLVESTSQPIDSLDCRGIV
jgi:hypothetical protein